MIQYGDLIEQKLKQELPPQVKVFQRFPENWRQFSPAVFIVFNGYDMVSEACSNIIVDTHWIVYISVKDAASQRDKGTLELKADQILRTVFNEIHGNTFDTEQVLPAKFNDRVSLPDLTGPFGIFPIGFSIRTTLTKT